MEEKTTSDDLMKFLQLMNDKMESTIKGVEKNINDKLEIRLNSLDTGMSDLRKEVKSNDKKAVDMNNVLLNRMERIEQDMRRSQMRRMNSDTLGRTSKLQQLSSQSVGKDDTIDQPEAQGLVRENSWANEVEEEHNKKVEEEKNKEVKRREEDMMERDKNQWIEKRRVPDDWTAGLRATVRQPVKSVDNPVKCVERTSKVEAKVRKAVRHWFGEDSDSSEDDVADDDHDAEDWNCVDRQKKNEMKKKRMNMKRNKKKEEVLEKVNHMVGIGPIDSEIIDYHIEKNHGDFEKAKLAAIREHLARFYKFNSSELDAVKIVETKYNKKMDGEGILYFATEDKQDIVDLYIRKSECKRDKVSLRNFVPPQIFKRFTAINKLCKQKREENSQLKTQIRFGKSDLIVLTKLRGSEDSFKAVNLEDFIGEADIPNYDHDIKWKSHKDRAPRRRVTSSRSSSPVPPATLNSRDELPTRAIRQLSINSDDGTVTKKRKGPESMDSCHSNDLAEAMKSNGEKKMDADETL